MRNYVKYYISLNVYITRSIELINYVMTQLIVTSKVSVMLFSL